MTRFAVAVVALTMLTDPARADLPPLIPRDVLFGNPEKAGPQISPDGKRLVFCHDMTGASELYVINANGTELTQITHDGTENLWPRWSPDGR